MSKVYLSLDDLHKLYGLSPAVLSAIKKKRKKRRKRKAKINNGTMGNKPSSSEHMAGYASRRLVEALPTTSATAVAAGQLQQANLNRYIADINQNNEKLRLTNDTTIKQPLVRPEYQQMIDGIESGKYKVKQKGNSISVINKELDKKPGPKPRNYEILSRRLVEALPTTSTPKTKNKVKLTSSAKAGFSRSDNVGATDDVSSCCPKSIIS
jgi:hypothetical protein